MTKFYNEYQSKKILQEYGLPTGEFALATDVRQAAKIAVKIGFPVAMKIVSDQIVHKTEAGGISLNVMDTEAASQAYDKLIANAKAYCPDAVIEGVLVSKMLPDGIEVIVGGTRDAQFGPVLMFGLGGVFVEIFKDVKFRMVPIDAKEAHKLIRSIQAYPMLCGARGRQPVNLNALADLLVRISQYLAENPHVNELDINPVLCYDDQVRILDASIGVIQK